MKCPSCDNDRFSEPINLLGAETPKAEYRGPKGKFGIRETHTFWATMARVCPDCGFFGLYMTDEARAAPVRGGVPTKGARV